MHVTKVRSQDLYRMQIHDTYFYQQLSYLISQNALTIIFCFVQLLTVYTTFYMTSQ